MLSYATTSHTGGRPVNEDALAVTNGKNGRLFVLCDGLGGHGGGQVASGLAVKAALEAFESASGPGGELLPLCIGKAQEALLAEQRRTGKPDELKTTITLLHIHEGTARWAHVGDSRVYLFCKDKLASHTQDHSVPQMLVHQGEIREKDIRFHEDRNRLTRVLGMEWDRPKYTLGDEWMVAPPASFLLCSDGFWEWIVEKDMAKTLRHSGTPDEWLDRMAQKVRQNGAGKPMDNYSAIAVFVRD